MHAEVQIEIKRFLERVYGLNVEAVRTVNYEGKRKRRKQGFFQESDYKKVPGCSHAVCLPWHAYAMTVGKCLLAMSTCTVQSGSTLFLKQEE